MLFTWNQRYNLTSILDPLEAARHHTAEALALIDLLEPDADDVLVDLGSGNGYPALPLLTAWPATRGVLCEAREARVAFLRAVLRETRLDRRVHVEHGRLAGPAAIPANATVVSMRAFPRPEHWIDGALARPRVRAVAAWLATADAERIAASAPAARAEVVPLAARPGASLLVLHRSI